MAFVYILTSATKLFDLETTNDSHGNAAGLESNRQKKLRLQATSATATASFSDCSNAEITQVCLFSRLCHKITPSHDATDKA